MPKNQENQQLIYKWKHNGVETESSELYLNLSIHEADAHSAASGEFLGVAMLMNDGHLPVFQREIKDIETVDLQSLKDSLISELGAKLEVA